MLVFFIHGVATHDVQYADKLKRLIKEEFDQRDKPLPYFYSSFWGDVLRDVGKIWNWIHQDLQEVKRDYPQTSIDDIFRYRKFREGFLSEFGAELKFRDGSGMLRFCVNPLKIHHVYLFDSKNNCKFVGYVGWIDSEGLKKEIEQIKQNYC